jgi:hypothetical protein
MKSTSILQFLVSAAVVVFSWPQFLDQVAAADTDQPDPRV